MSAENLHEAIRSMSLSEDEPIDFPDSPSFRVFDENAISILGRLVNPDCQPMDKMIEDMPRVWRVYDRVRGIALSREKFQFIFQREEDLVTVLNDRPWSYNNWMMLIDRWIPTPPTDFLTSVDLWVRISRIPMNYYKLDTITWLARRVGEVLEVAYDPEASQKETYIRALVRLNIRDPAITTKPVNFPTGEKVIIEYDYEKLRKFCFHCHRLTHECPACPYLRGRISLPSTKQRLELTPVPTVTSNALVPVTESSPSVPPGFPPLFADLPAEERRMALQYVSHSDATERQERIMRVNQSIELERGSLKMPKVTYDLDKGKGHVFGFDQQSLDLVRENTVYGKPVISAPPPNFLAKTSSNLPDDQEGSSSSFPVNSTVFRIGMSSDRPSAGVNRSIAKRRKRPTRGKRQARAKATAASAPLLPEDGSLDILPISATRVDQPSLADPSLKRKDRVNAGDHSAKSLKTSSSTVASALKPLLPQ
ncbi:unnamed protein product [Microthlaspi erraticum]|uniref:DUF4283 domain-containing protein n=1 Tax=Microthlaspi erraticum TaxID=1685480 RepID=A0A6D2JLR0_9BRAS|nr:unnamed protein product [Microthlaspi erraticum]